MRMLLTCGKCLRERAVERWTPAAMRCPKCGSESLSDGFSVKERERRVAKQKESERRAHAEQHKKAGP
jgi:PHP family Zn ribbon phosphoesterase